MSVLSLTNPTLADGRDVYLSATRTALDLNFTGTDTVRAFYIDNVAQPSGLYGRIGSLDPNDTETALITGDGLLRVGVPGDFNNNGFVDSADYILWREGVQPLPANEVSTIGTTDPQDYTDWRERFGNPTPGQPPGGALDAAGVPEPAACVLAALVVCGLGLFRVRI
jgi:hypothetical protein